MKRKPGTASIANPDLATQGRSRTEWAASQMPVLTALTTQFRQTRPLAGQRVAACLHVTTETANLVLALQAAGCEISLCASNPLSTQDDVAAHLARDHGVSVHAVYGASAQEYYTHINRTLDLRPTITMDDGCDLVHTLHRGRRELLPGVIGGTEETTTGVIRLRAMARDAALSYPVIAVNDALTKHLFDNRYGTGQSTIDGILRATNVLLAGRTVVVAGYGWCGRGIAMRARGLGALVIITEIDPVKALEAAMDGFSVMPMSRAAKIGDVFITVTGNTKVISEPHFRLMKDGAIVCNSGHFNVEVDIESLAALARSRRIARENVEEFVLADGRRIRLLAEGRLVNLAAAEGHPAAVMDMSFANQTLAVQYLAAHAGTLRPGVYPMPAELDAKVARLKLRTLGLSIDRLTPEQRGYLASYEHGT